MTIVELYDDKPINNIVGTLAFSPDKVIFVGGHAKKKFESRMLPILRKYLDKKGFPDIFIEYVQVRRDSLRDIIDRFEQIYAENAGCKFHVEVTGGEDLVLIALGALCQRHPEIELYQISSKLRTLRSFSVGSDDGVKLDIDCANSVEENLLLHGGSVMNANGSEHLPDGYVWDIVFFQDIMTMWDILRSGVGEVPSAPNAWNKVTTALGEIVREGAADSENPNSAVLNTQYFKNTYLKSPIGDLLYDYICVFLRSGLLDCRIQPDYTYIDFKNDQVRMCLTKAGLLLELKMYLICAHLFKQRGGDCMTGVTIDWDGDEDLASDVKYLADPDDPTSTIDTTNEIDILATCGLTPYFISCKNGVFSSEELYKLYSVAERFGGTYSKKLIVTTDSEYALGDAGNILRQRAADMGIKLIERVHEKSDDEISEELAEAMKLPKAKAAAVS